MGDALTWFAWGVAAGVLTMQLLARGYERLLQERIELADKRAELLQARLDEREQARLDILAARVDLALNFAAVRRAARDEVRS